MNSVAKAPEVTDRGGPVAVSWLAMSWLQLCMSVVIGYVSYLLAVKRLSMLDVCAVLLTHLLRVILYLLGGSMTSSARMGVSDEDEYRPLPMLATQSSPEARRESRERRRSSLVGAPSTPAVGNPLSSM